MQADLPIKADKQTHGDTTGSRKHKTAQHLRRRNPRNSDGAQRIAGDHSEQRDEAFLAVAQIRIADLTIRLEQCDHQNRNDRRKKQRHPNKVYLDLERIKRIDRTGQQQQQHHIERHQERMQHNGNGFRQTQIHLLRD